jgi:hypothetical protein
MPYPTSQAVTAQADKRSQKKDTTGIPPPMHEPKHPWIGYEALATPRPSKSTLRFNAMTRPSTPSRRRIE